MNDKFLVLEWKDINCLTDETVSQLSEIIMATSLVRFVTGKKTDNQYIVVDKDEPYAQEIIDILRNNGHWDN